MLLSVPTWIVHISSMLEWGLAALLLYRYGSLIGREDVKKFALLMLPHWAGGWCVIAFHLTNDEVEFWLDASKTVNLVGSVCLLYGALRLGVPRRSSIASALVGLAMAIAPAFQLALDPQWKAKIIDAIFQLSSLVYLAFLVSLLVVHRRDKTIFSPITVFGFWFVIVFVGVTIVCMHFSKLRGYPTLTHDDLLHGFAESLLTASNLLIVVGIQRKLAEATLRSACVGK
ncbi:MAG: DUF2499 domain-containing protein [Chloroherpetonaceae bacterium]|nr:DUF2499 domain-containing protein [Chloroherpetonaceae bacterium]